MTSVIKEQGQRKDFSVSAIKTSHWVSLSMSKNMQKNCSFVISGCPL